jgi:hypothetical protein
MSRNQIDFLLVGLCLLAEVGIFFGLTALGTSHGLIILAVLVLMMGTCWIVGESGPFPVDKEEDHER